MLAKVTTDGEGDPRTLWLDLARALGAPPGAVDTKRLWVGLPLFVEVERLDVSALAALGVVAEEVRSRPPRVEAPAAAAARVAEAWGPLRGFLGEVAPEALAALRPPALAIDVEITEQRLGIALPDDVIAWLALHDGAEGAGPFGDDLSTLADALSSKRTLDEVNADVPVADEYVEPGAGVARAWWHPRWLPLLADGAGNALCLDLAPATGGRVGQLIQFWHDGGERDVVAPSFLAWLTLQRDRVLRGEIVPTAHGDGSFCGMLKRTSLTGQLATLHVRGERPEDRSARVDSEVFGHGIELLKEILPRLERAGHVELACRTLTPEWLDLMQSVAAAIDAAPAGTKRTALLTALRASPHLAKATATAADIDEAVGAMLRQ